MPWLNRHRKKGQTQTPLQETPPSTSCKETKQPKFTRRCSNRGNANNIHHSQPQSRWSSAAKTHPPTNIGTTIETRNLEKQETQVHQIYNTHEAEASIDDARSCQEKPLVAHLKARKTNPRNNKNENTDFGPICFCLKKDFTFKKNFI